MIKFKKKRKAKVAAMVLAFMCLFSQQAFAENMTISYTLEGEKTAAGVYTDGITVNYEAESPNKVKQIVLSKDSAGTNIIENNKKEYAVTDEAPDKQSGAFLISKTWLSQNEPDGLTQTVYLVAEDKNAEKSSKAVTFKADVDGPSVGISGAEDGDSYNTSKKITFSAKDSNLSNDSIYMMVKRDGQIIAQASNEEEFNNNKEVTCSETGSYTAEIKVQDQAGRTAEKKISFLIDKEGPSITNESVSGSSRDGRSWFYDDVKIVGAAEKNKADLSEVTVTINGEEVFKNTSSKESLNFSKEIENSWLSANPSKEYKAVITVKDEAGNTAIKTIAFKADNIKPEVGISGIESGAITNKSPEIDIILNDFNKDEEGTTLNVTIKRNGTVISEETAKNSFAYTPKGDGAYEITAVGTDVAGNVSEEAKVSFSYDTTKPKIEGLSISGPKRSGYSWFYSYVDILTRSSDEFSGLSDVQIEVNGEKVQETNPKGALLNDLNKRLSRAWIESNEDSDGKYTIKVSAQDKAGNKSSKTNTIHIDTKTPSVELFGIKKGTHTKSTPTVGARVSDNFASKNTIYFEVYRDGKRVKRIHRSGSESAINSFGSDGDYVVKAYSVDKAGNRSSKKSLSFTKDTKAPVVTLSGAREGSFNRGTIGLKARIEERNYKYTTVKTTLTRKLDGKTTVLSFPVKPNKKIYVTTKGLRETGTYIATIYAVDKAGNKSATRKLSFTVDNTKPKLKISGVLKENGYESIVAPKIVFSDSFYASKNFSLTKTGTKKPEGITFKDNRNQKGGSRVYSDFMKSKGNDGIYTLSCSIKDKAGNVSTEKVTFKVNRFGSKYAISKFSRPINGTYTKELLDDIVLNEYNVTGLKKKEVVVIKDGAPIADPKIKETKRSLKDGTLKYTYRINADNFKDEGAYSINATSEDTVGNFSEYSKDNKAFKVFVDKTPPMISITGVEDGGTYKSGESLVTVNVRDSIALSDYKVYYGNELVGTFEGGSESSAPISLPDGVRKTLSVSAQDKAGNTSSEEIRDVTISSSAFTRLLTNKPLAIGLLGILPAAAIAAAVLFILKRRKAQA